MPKFVTLGIFIVDEFHYLDENGRPTGRAQENQVRDMLNSKKAVT